MSPRVSPYVLAAIAAAALALSCARCGGDPAANTPADAGADARPDAGPDARDATQPDANTGWDGDVISDYPGWRRVSGLPNCTMDAPMDLAKEVPPWKWIPCKNGAANCQEFDVGWTTSLQKFALAGGGPAGPHGDAIVRLQRNLPDLADEMDLYTLSSSGSGSPLAAYRYNPKARDCLFQAGVGDGGISLFALVFGSGFYVSHPATSQELANPSFARLADEGSLPGVGGDYARSATKFVMGQAGAGVIVVPVGKSTYSFERAPVAVHQVNLDFVQGDDVFAQTIYGDADFAQEYVSAPDGTLSLAIGKPQTHIYPVCTDGKALYWVERYGDPTADWAHQPKADLWTAPYSNDRATIAATARKVPVTMPTAQSPCVAANGVVMVFATEQLATVVRVADAATQTLDIGPGRGWGFPVLLTSNEYFGLSAIPGGLNGTAFVRIALGAWTPAK